MWAHGILLAGWVCKRTGHKLHVKQEFETKMKGHALHKEPIVQVFNSLRVCDYHSFFCVRHAQWFALVFGAVGVALVATKVAHKLVQVGCLAVLLRAKILCCLGFKGNATSPQNKGIAGICVIGTDVWSHDTMPLWATLSHRSVVCQWGSNEPRRCVAEGQRQ